MSGPLVSGAGFLVLLAAAAVLELRARRSGSPARAAEALGAAMRTTGGRLTVLAVWFWLGVHFLAR
ncbi:DUF6186 family protein [Blastococcus xanthinilyticus]|uniref:Uncharacterized protein n=1 Tax=Blastococcus xanthinilyticus TaxID=1564164 RepID=A0A5S5D0R8_9ACTN|nr:DUF6186 family protein [Blastococcus xanthinilyticus]TYP88944.1 hypothetical protein BD833_103100 [Blastococcus xanthinilyticus]